MILKYLISLLQFEPVLRRKISFPHVCPDETANSNSLIEILKVSVDLDYQLWGDVRQRTESGLIGFEEGKSWVWNGMHKFYCN